MSYIVKKNIAGLGQRLGVHVSAEAFPVLSAAVEDMIDSAKDRAVANGRKVIKARDL